MLFDSVYKLYTSDEKSTFFRLVMVRTYGPYGMHVNIKNYHDGIKKIKIVSSLSNNERENSAKIKQQL